MYRPWGLRARGKETRKGAPEQHQWSWRSDLVSGLLSQGSGEDVVGRSGWLCECVVVWRGSAEAERGAGR